MRLDELVFSNLTDAWDVAWVLDRTGGKVSIFRATGKYPAYPEGHFAIYADWALGSYRPAVVCEPVVAQCLLYEWGCKPCT